MVRGALILAIVWAALAVQTASSEALKVAGVAAAAGALLAAPGVLAALVRHRALAVGVGVIVLGSCFALEPAVWIGSAARGQGALVALALTVLAAAASGLTGPDRRVVQGVAAVLGGAVAAYALIQYAGLDPWSWQGTVDRRPSATLSNANTLAGWLLLLLPVTLGCVLGAGRGRAIWIALGLLQCVALLATGTRSAVAALAMAALGIWLLADARRWRLALPLLLAALVAVAGLAAWRPASLQDRLYLWRSAVAALSAPEPVIDLQGNVDRFDALRPWLGHGLDLQQPALVAASSTTPGARTGADGWIADRAHQGLLDRALELGVAGVLAALMLIVAVQRALWCGWRSGDPGRRREALLLGTALAAWLLHLQAGFALTGDRTLAWVWIGMALALAREPADRGASGLPASPSGWRRALAVVLGAVLLFGALAASGRLSPSMLAHVAPALQAERDYVDGQAAYAQALAATGSDASRHMEVAAVAFERAVGLRRHDLDAALGAASARIERAALAGTADDAERARAWAQAARRVAPAEPRLAAIDARIAEVAARLKVPARG